VGGLTIVSDLNQLDALEWDALGAGHPFSSHAYLLALQESGSVDAATGWQPLHLALHREGRLVAAMPLYLKTHSRGEYVFDMIWAHAFERHGLAYYPKLLCAIPFTPVPGPRLLAANANDRTALIDAAMGLAREHELSSVHVLFPETVDRQALIEAGFMVRHDVQFHWRNEHYRDLDDFLSRFNQAKRKKIRQDSRQVRQAGVRFRHVTGDAVDDEILSFFFRCYRRTYLEHGNPPYLNLDFFRRLRASMPESLLIVLALLDDEPVAAALNIRGGDRLFGRYWGAMQFVSGLHFETCYMQAIGYCIEHGLEGFEGGAQGEHKLARGMLPERTSSAHWVRDQRYAAAIGDFLRREKPAVDLYLSELRAHSPFKRREDEAGPQPSRRLGGEPKGKP